MTVFLDVVTVIYGLTFYRLPWRRLRSSRLALRRIESDRLWTLYVRLR